MSALAFKAGIGLRDMRSYVAFFIAATSILFIVSTTTRIASWLVRSERNVCPQADLGHLRQQRTATSSTQWFLFFGLQGESPENGSFPGFGWRLLGMFGAKSSNINLQRLSAMIKARVWRAFLIQRKKFSETRNA
jgi:hypothetical protein